MLKKVLIVINSLALAVFLYWLYIDTKPEPLGACVLGSSTLIALIWKRGKKERSKGSNNKNSPITGKVKNQTINYFHTTSNPGPEKGDQQNNNSEKGKTMNEKDEGKNINVTSHHQMGGITAYQVNVGSQPRTLDASLQSNIDSLLAAKKGQAITIESVMGDDETFSLASEIKEYLVKSGFSVKGVNQTAFSIPVKGLHFDGEKLVFTIGSKE